MKTELREKSVELLAQLHKVSEEARGSKLTRPEDVALETIDITSKKREYFISLYLDNTSHVIKRKKLAGTVNGCSVWPREIAKTALLCDASCVIMVHNHPGGSLEFSNPDRAITNQVYKGLKTLGILLQDHVIVSNGGFASYRQKHGISN